MSEEDLRALDAAKRYGKDATFQHISDELEVSKSHAQVLVRRGIEILEAEKVVNDVSSEPDPVVVDVVDTRNLPPPTPPSYLTRENPLTVDPYSQHNYELELKAIDKKLTMTGFEILVYDNFCNNGYMGTFSDFCREAIQALYYRTTPQGRTL